MARYLSRADLSRIAGKYIDQYYTRFGISKDAPEPIDPERLASAVLGLNVKMLPLCSDGSVLGLTVFQRCGFTVTLGDGTKLVEIFMPKDVVIDSALAADGCTGCRNFTIAHEAAHQILADLFPNDYGKAVKCRGHIAYRERNGQPSWEEWQANTLAAELLMPTFLVNAEIELARLCLPNGILYKSASDPNYKKILEMAARMGVSWSAIRIRLQQMQVIKNRMLEAELQNKNNELTLQTTALVKRNQAIQSLLEELEKQKETLGERYPNKLYIRMKTLMEETLNNQADWVLFESYFNSTHQNFMDRLRQRYSDLTTGDLRICCLLRMNLSTKEIASLMNVSVRAIELRRYRLRKRLELEGDTNLVDFLMNF